MLLKNILSLFLIVICSNLFAQEGLYYDALFFRYQILNADDKIPSKKIDTKPMQEYFKKYALLRNDNFLDSAAFSNNPFLKEFYPRGGSASLNGAYKGLDIPGLISSVGGYDVTTIADGLAKFLVERTKQELSITFFDRFRQDLEEMRQLQILFPATYHVLHAMGDEIYNYASYLEVLREAFQKDLATLIPNLQHLIEDSCMDQLFQKHPEIRTILLHALYIANELSDGKHPGEAVHNYIVNKADSASLRPVNQYLYPSLKTLDLFSQSLRSRQSDQYWISADSLQLLFKDEITVKLYFGLIYQYSLNHKIYFDANTTLHGTLDSLATQLDSLQKKYKPYLVGLIERGKAVDSNYKTLRKKQESDTKPTYQDYYALYDASLNFLEYLVKGPGIFNLQQLDITQSTVDKYFSTARSLGNIYVDVNQKQYASAIVELGSIYRNVIEPAAKTDISALTSQIDAASGTTKDELKKQKKELEKLVKSSSVMVKYGAFISAVAKAETSDEVQQAIEAVALPAGSARIKRETPFNVALNAYVGFYGGWEKIDGVDKRFEGTFGLSAPVGISVSSGHHILFFETKSAWSTSFFLSLIDVGAIASYRFSETEVKSLTEDTTTVVHQIPRIELKDIVSPGAFISIGIPKTPLSVNLGAQLGPNLRKISATSDSDPDAVLTNEYADKMYWRFSASIVVDIPVLNFYTKSRK